MMLLRDVPPGLTHDEADHGITAWSIVEGVRAIYFTIGYGREPFYDYATAVLMSFLGPTYLAGRLTAVFFSLPLIAAMYAWVKRAFDPTTALLTAASLATSFWPLMVGRQALRSTTLPTLFALAVLLFWLGLKRLEIGERRLRQSPTTTTPLHHYTNPYFLATGLLIGLTFYTYIPARILWGVFPATAVYLMLARRKGTGKVWWGVLLIGGLGLIVAAPLFSYLANNPGTEVRIDELQTPLTAVLDGNVSPLWQNIRASLRLFTIEGDSTIRYNLPGRPFLQPIMGILFYIGLAFAVWHTIQPFRTHKKISFTDSSVAAFLAIAWLLAGISPSLVTGPRWSMTQAVGMQPILYLFPALAVAQIGKLRFRDTALSQYKVSWLIVGLVWGITAVIASNDYFNRWANDSDVRVQYETTMVAAMEYLNANGSGDVAISTITPDPVHTPALAQMTLTNKTITPHWFNGQDSLLIPESASSTVVFPGFTPLPAAFATYFAPAQPIAELTLRETDLD
ncbi:MAG: glycosyltransferase family 39 protein, partial [Chloroflexota bacterium]